jgi:glycosyltransferase involved in cell wall biosynthesis
MEVIERQAPKRVLLFGSFAPSLINFRGALIADMVRCGHEVTAAAPQIDPRTAAALQALRAEPRCIALSNASLSVASLLRSFASLRRLIREVRPDVVIGYTIKPVILAALAGRAERVPRIVALITGLGFAFTGGLQAKRLVSRVAASLLYRLALARADVILFQNPDDQKLFRQLRLLPRTKASAVIDGSGIDTEHFRPVASPCEPSFLMISRLLRDKGIREFAAAAARLKAAHPEVRIALVGYLDPSPDSISQEDLDRMIGSGIEFLGKLDDVRPAIAACSVHVLPSYREGTPRSVLEAMAMGRAIITTDAPGCRETVIEGRNGFLVPPRDPDALYWAMLRFVEQPALAAAMGAESRKIAEEKYDVRKVNADLMRHAGL